LIATLIGNDETDWLVLTAEGYFNAAGDKNEDTVSIVRGQPASVRFGSHFLAPTSSARRLPAILTGN
jgi:hypothetical protein